MWNCDSLFVYLCDCLIRQKKGAQYSLIYLFNLCVISGREIRALRTRNLCGLSFSCCVFIFAVISDENRDLNGHTEDDIKRNRTQYNGDPLYANVSVEEENNKIRCDFFALRRFGRPSCWIWATLARPAAAAAPPTACRASCPTTRPSRPPPRATSTTLCRTPPRTALLLPRHLVSSKFPPETLILMK